MPSWLAKIRRHSDSKIKDEHLYYRWVMLAALLIIATISSGIVYSFGVFFKSLEREFGWTRAMTSGVLSVNRAFHSLFAIAGGWALDKYGAKIVITLLGFFTGLSLLLTSQVDKPWQLFISYSLLLAIGTGPVYIVITATISRWFTRKRGLALGLVTSGHSIGILTIVPLSAYLISRYGWQTSYFILGLIAIFIIIPCAQLIMKSPSEAKASTQNESLGTANPGSPQPHGKPTGFSLSQAVKTKNFWFLFFMWSLLGFCLFIVTTHIVPYATDLGINPIQAASILSFYGGMNILGRVSMGRISDSIGRKETIIISSLISAGAMLWLSQASELWMLYLFAAVFGIAYGGLVPPTTALFGDIYGLQHIGLLIGIMELGWGIGSAIGPAFAGYIFDTTGEYVIAFLAGMAVTLISTVLVSLLKTPNSYQRRDEST